jgi:cytochrome P450
VTIQNFEIPEFHRVITDTIPGHRDPEIWGKDPDTFNPWRFETPMTPAQKEAYMPWGGGQRYCVGMRFGIFCSKLLIFKFLQKFQVRVPPRYTPLLQLTPTLSLQNGLPAQVHIK